MQLYQRDLHDPGRSLEPQLRFDCYEAITEWLDEQDGVIGCQYHLWEQQILDRLGRLQFCNFVVNGEDWMKPDSKDPDKRNRVLLAYSAMKAFPNAIDEFIGEFLDAGNPELADNEAIHQFLLECIKSPVYVFYYLPAGLRYPALMHHKFMIGIKHNDPNGLPLNDHLLRLSNPSQIADANGRRSISELVDRLELSAIYGSFNLAPSASQNLESILVFRQNRQLCTELIREWMRARAQSVPYGYFFEGSDVDWYHANVDQTIVWDQEVINEQQ
ncbi:hypothetical protein [Synechococcus sp. BO 8801]|uniref:hypothetical protein n=1 Tax=Synechococcus sp. BO 8801 TaxID=169670 RepID=UPI001E43268D|nr:hypothetical protein [Synechococcus sp. BO 8801]